MKTHGDIKRRRRIPGLINDEIMGFVHANWTPAQIHEYLKGSPGLPTIRTIQRMVKDNRQADRTDPWLLQNVRADVSDPGILQVVAEVVRWTKARHKVTILEAEWISRINAVAPSLPLWARWQAARRYIHAQESDESTFELDLWLAFRPWEDTDRHNDYRDTLRRAGIFREIDMMAKDDFRFLGTFEWETEE